MRLLAPVFRNILFVTVLIVTQYHPVVAAEKMVFGWVTFQDTKWPSPYSGGSIPSDSLPWDVLTHLGLFAANGSAPPQSSYINQYGAFTKKAHEKGVFAGITVGGSSDGALVTMIGNSASWNNWITTYLGYLDAHKMDFIEFDFEGSYSATNIGNFFQTLYDSLQTRQSGNDPSRHPYIVLTASLSHTISWSSATIRNTVEFVNMMTYDYNNNAWGRVTFDNSPKSYKYYNGTGGATDSIGSGVNAIAPSMQRQAIRANAAGWPMSKLNVGMDYNGGSWGNATVIRQSTSGTTDGGSNATFAGNWSTFSQIPADSIFFDQIAQAYWARVGSNLWTWLSLPGRDSGVIATRKVVDSMGLGGVCIWNLGNEVWNASPVPPGGKGWFFSQLRRHFNYSGVQPPPPPPPPVDTIAPAINMVRPANGDSLTGTVTVEASASDNVGVTSVQFLLDGAALGSPDASSPYTYNWNTDPVADGNHTLSAVARDQAGLQARRDITVRLYTPPPPPPPPVDTVAPQVAFVAPSNGDTLMGTVTIQASASDNAGVSSVRFLLDNNALGAQDNSAPYTLSWNTDPVIDGSHTLSAIARDLSGLETRRDIGVWLTSPPPPPPPPPDTIPAGGSAIAVYVDAIASPWINGSWSSTNNFQSTERVYAGTAAVKAVQSAWGAVSFHSGSWASPVPVNTSAGDNLRLTVYPESLVTLRVELQNDLGETFGFAMLEQVPAGVWSTYVLPVQDLNPGNLVVHQVTVQNYLNRTVTYHLDEMKFITSNDTTVVDTTVVEDTTVTPTLKYDRLFVDFGDVGIGDEKTDSVQVINDNDFDVVVTDLRTTSGRFTARLDQTSIAAKSSRKLYLGFKPDRRATETDLVISFAGAVTRVDTVRLRGTGAKRGRSRYSRGTIVVPPPPEDGMVSDSFYVTNDGDLSLNLSSVTTTHAAIEVSPATAVIPANDSLLFRLSISPKNGKSVSGYVILTPTTGAPDSIGIEMDAIAGTTPGAYALSQNYPNPFNPETRINYTLPSQSYVRMIVYNVFGQEVAILRDGIENGGTGEVIWNGKSNDGASVPSGAYFFRLDARDIEGSGTTFTSTRSMLLIK